MEVVPGMRVAMLSHGERRALPRTGKSHGRLISLLTQELVSRGVDVTVFAAPADASPQRPDVKACCRENGSVLDPGIADYLLIGDLFERAKDFDLVHNFGQVLPLSCSGLVTTPLLTTISSFTLEDALPLYKRYNSRVYYVSTSDEARSPELDYLATVRPGVDVTSFPFGETSQDYLLFLGDIGPDGGAVESMHVCRMTGKKLILAGTICDSEYFASEVEPGVRSGSIQYLERVEPDEMKEILSRALALLEPAACSDPLFLSALEANACGTPVIAFADRGVREIIENGVNGFVVDSVAEAVEAVSRLDEISRFSCRRLAKTRFSSQRMADEYLFAYSRILEASRREERRPWGYYEILADSTDYKVKRIVLYPGKRLSLQRHSKRSEQWTIVSGSPIVVRDDRTITLRQGESVHIPVGAKHRIANPSNELVVFVEVQTGDYFGEDDIERFDDDFGRI